MLHHSAKRGTRWVRTADFDISETERAALVVEGYNQTLVALASPEFATYMVEQQERASRVFGPGSQRPYRPPKLRLSELPPELQHAISPATVALRPIPAKTGAPAMAL